MKIKTIIIGIIVALGLSSCSTELKLANRFVNDSHAIRAAVYFPEEAKVTLVQSESGDYTKVLDSLDQNAFLDIMYAAYAEELRSFGVDVYIPDDPDHVMVDSMNWLVVYSQVEIQGRITPYKEQFYDMVNEYEFTVPLNTVNVASWFDISDGEWLPTLFDEYNLMEDYEPRIDYKGGSLSFQYDIDTLTMADVYNYSVLLGKRYADFTHSAMMNRFVKEQMLKENAKPRFKMRWDPHEEVYYLLEDEEGFIELEP